jgi:polysaccharide export outer membrane protein
VRHLGTDADRTGLTHRRSDRRKRWVKCAAAATLAAAALCALSGCETPDSFLDPSVLGYWENTPTMVPILSRLDAIEGLAEEYVEVSQVVREDLIAQAQAYRLGPSDEIEITIRNFSQVGRDDMFPRRVDQRGYITLPNTAPIYLLGKTDAEARLAVVRAIEEAQIIQNPVVSVVTTGQRQQTFSVIGAVRNPGQYFIPKPDYRLLEALTAAGGFDESLEHVFVIRQVPLSEAVQGRGPAPADKPSTTIKPTPKKTGDQLLKEIEDLSTPKKPGGEPKNPDDAPLPPPPPPGGGLGTLNSSQPVGEQPQPPAQPKPKPAIDLPEPQTPPAPSSDQAPAEPPVKSKSRWVFLNGQWVRAARGISQPGTGLPEGAPPGAAGEGLMTQRVIEIPLAPLIAGQSDMNIVIKPGDVVRIPVSDNGLFYMTGAVSRPGPYNLPPNGHITIEQAVVSAGGLSSIAIPERVDITRRVGKDRQATIRLNLRAIAKRTQPEVYLKSNDTINVGTNFWAVPLAVFRNGLRASYGFGFILDRNFAGDVFGTDRSLVR